jgi:hypothetical protein
MKSITTTLLVLICFCGITASAKSEASELKLQAYLGQTLTNQTQQMNEALAQQLQQSIRIALQKFSSDQTHILYRPYKQTVTTVKQTGNKNTITTAE